MVNLIAFDCEKRETTEESNSPRFLFLLLVLFCSLSSETHSVFRFRYIFQRIDILSIGLHAEMKMRSCGISGGTNVTDELSFGYPVSYAQTRSKPALVHVLGLQGFPVDGSVGDLDIVSCGIAPLTYHDGSGSRGVNRCSAGCGDVDAPCGWWIRCLQENLFRRNNWRYKTRSSAARRRYSPC